MLVYGLKLSVMRIYSPVLNMYELYISETSNIEKIRICNLKEHTYFLLVSDKVIFGLFEEMPLKLKYNYILPYNYVVYH